MVNAVSSTSSYIPSTSNSAQSALQLLLQLLQSSQSSQSSPASTGTSQTSPATSTSAQTAQSLFSQINTNGSGSITQADLEAAVTKAGGTKQSADALWAKLDPNNASSLNEQQFAQGLQTLQAARGGHHHHHGGGAGASTIDITISISDGTAQDTGGISPSSSGSVLDTVA